MKQLLTKNATLNKLSEDIKVYSDKIQDRVQKRVPSADSSSTLSQEQAARIIQRAWRGKKIKETVVKSPYFSYLSMIDPDDEQMQLSALMFGRHVAEIRLGARERIDNPLINTKEFYHRSVHLSSVVTDTLFKEFNIPNFDTDAYTYMPITLLKNNPIEDVLALFRDAIPDLQLIKKEPYTIAVLVIPNSNPQHDQLKEKVKNMGLVASSWEIAENIKSSKIELPQNESSSKITMDPNLPKTKEELLNSEIIIKLNRIATSGGRYPTKILAKCLQRLLNDLPPDISSQAIQRIAVMLDLTNTFYSFNYPRYALCVYSILHEISLALLKNTDDAYLEKEYEKFQEESATSLSRILDLDSASVNNSTFIATASTSGVSACTVAIRIASKMKTADGGPLKVKIFKPCYYELPNISSLDNANTADEADVLMISTGPIVNPEGLTPGIDINRFVQRHVINAHRTKPLTIVIDATTTLYKNVKLEPQVQKLVADGKLSIIIHESHQKFGLIHSDQAQYGRVFGWCSNDHFKKEDLQEIQDNSKDDFYKHVDIRIGAFVSTRCKEILEDIKQRHFSNGALLRNILIHTSLISRHIEKHDDMLRNLDELYFLNDNEIAPGTYTSRLERAAFGVIDYRASFGHYAPATTGVLHQRRLSPDATDDIDALVQACHIRLSQDHSPRTMLSMLIEGAREKDTLSLEQQIISTGMLHNIISNTRILPRLFGEVKLITTLATDNDIKSLINSAKNPKDILFINTPESVRIAYCSHDNQFKQIEIKDPKIVALVKAGTITSPKNFENIRAYLRALQTEALPKQTNFPVIYSAMSNALESCPLLEGRQYDLNINTWLAAVKERIVQQYNPVKPQLFLDAMRTLYNMRIPLKDTELQVLSQQPETCRYIKDSRNASSLMTIIAFSMHMGPSVDCSKLLKNEDFTSAILKVYSSNEEILAGLRKAPRKHKEATESSKAYLNSCFKALYDYYSIQKPSEHNRTHLLKSVKSAEEDYLKVLSKDRNSITQIARYILKAVTNFIASLTFGVAHYLNYKATGNISFFSGTNSENKLKKFHKELNEDLENGAPLAAG